MTDRNIEIAKEGFAPTQRGLAELTPFLIDAGVHTVAMEATGIYSPRCTMSSKGSSRSCGCVPPT